MILAVDVDYRDSQASIAGLAFRHWQAARAEAVFHSVGEGAEDYIPGQFYLRELPCILQLLAEHHLSPDAIVIDGYVDLGDESRPGLGRHLFNALEGRIPVIGVAKTPFDNTNRESEIRRGNSQRPLYVTSAGIRLERAKRYILSMHGNHRLPTLLREVDRECRKAAKGSPSNHDKSLITLVQGGQVPRICR